MGWQVSLNNQNILTTPTERDLAINLDFSIEKNEAKQFFDNQAQKQSKTNNVEISLSSKKFHLLLDLEVKSLRPSLEKKKNILKIK